MVPKLYRSVPSRQQPDGQEFLCLPTVIPHLGDGSSPKWGIGEDVMKSQNRLVAPAH